MTLDCAVILLDVNMPGMDGFETANLIHGHPRFEKTPIIFVTAISLSDLDRLQGYELGAVDYVMVPIVPAILRGKVSVLCELYRMRRDLQVANAQLAAANTALQIEKARELEQFNESLRVANETLVSRNAQLQKEAVERERIEAQLRDLGRRKDEFLAMLAHELRNPLASISNALNVFKLTAKETEPLCAVMERQMGLLLRLIDDLLDAARISRGKLTLKYAPVTLREILDSALQTIAPLLTAEHRPLKFLIPATDVIVDADGDRLSQVISNLLSNAVKYSDPDTPIVLGVDARDREVQVFVEDRGIGLTAGQSQRIFELFAQADTSIERSRGGLGIGLTLAKTIVELHGGHIGVHSDGLGKGSRFTVCLPLKPPHVQSSTPDASAKSLAAQRDPEVRCRALVVDDNKDAADTLVMMLQLLGHDARCIYDPQATIETVDAFAPDIVFLDIGMPGLSGHDVARNLRSQPHRDRLIIVAVTGWGEAEARRRSIEAGFDHHLVKPVRIDAIRQICDDLEPRKYPK